MQELVTAIAGTSWGYPSSPAPSYSGAEDELNSRHRRRPDAFRPRILVIDDETAIADSLVEILSVSGFDASASYSGKSAIEQARQQCPYIVLSDVVMPRMNGVETVLAIREICPEAHILLFSGQAGTSDILEQARKRGEEFELLPKPLHPEELLKRLSRYR